MEHGVDVDSSSFIFNQKVFFDTCVFILTNYVRSMYSLDYIVVIVTAPNQPGDPIGAKA